MIIQNSKKNPKAPITKPADSPDYAPKNAALPSGTTENKPAGLGDRVERIAKPIAKVIDRVAHTDLQNCGGCKKRKEYLNEKFPI